MQTSLTGCLASQLLLMSFPPVQYLVEGLIAQGVTLLVGRAKKGKSWMCLDLAIAIASGGLFCGSIKCEQGQVLYLALEDTLARLKNRMEKMLGSDGEWSENLFLETRWEALDGACITNIEQWIASVENPKLVIIDTLAMIKPKKPMAESIYEADYRVIQPFKELFSKHGISVIFVHHERKMAGEDAFDSVSGSTGLTGAVDATVLLRSVGGQMQLYTRGRDVEEQEVAVEFCKQSFRWQILGNAVDVRRSEERTAIINVLSEADAEMGLADVATLADMDKNNCKQLLLKMVRSGEVIKNGKNKYSVGTDNQ